MTKEFVIAESASMELDLDSFLDSVTSSDEDKDNGINSELRSVRFRTIDEILNDCDTSSSSPPSNPSSPSHSRHSCRSSDLSVNRQDSNSLKDAVFSNKSVFEFPIGETEKNSEAQGAAQLGEKVVQSRTRSISRVKPIELSDNPFRRASRPFPSLFGGVRPNAKPGAALAAAAASARSIPTPHAATIKSMRAGSGTLHKAPDSGEVSSIIGDDSDISSNGELGGAGPQISMKLEEDEEKFDKSQSYMIDQIDGLSSKVETLESKKEISENITNERFGNEAEIAAEVDDSEAGNATIEAHDDYSLKVKENRNLDEYSAISRPNEVEDASISTEENNSKRDMNSVLFSAKDNDFNEEASSYHDNGNNGIADDGLKVAGFETEELVNGSTSVKDYENKVAVGGTDDGSSVSDVDELVEERLGQLKSIRASRRAEKNSNASLKPLDLAEELEKKHASTGLHWEEGAAAQPMRLEGVRRESTTLGYFDVNVDNAVTMAISSYTFRREHGTPQVLAVHANYIAVGMMKGLIVVIPSKYSTYHADNFDGKMLMLAIQGDRLHPPVTSMSFNQQGDLLLAGYGDGHVTIWDVQKAVVAKVISGEHTAPVVHTLFLGQDPQSTRQFKAITGDSKGLVLLHSSSVVPLLNRFSIKTQCLLDGQRTGIVLSASPLLLDEVGGSASPYSQGNTVASTSSISSMMGGVVGGDAGWKLFNEGSSLFEEGVVVFVTHQNALVVRLTPTVEIYAQFSKPDGIREGSMPYTAWKCMSQPQNMPVEAVERVSLLAIAWDRKVQVAKLVKSELKVYGKWSLDSAAIGLAWLDDQMLVVLTSTGQLYLFAKDGTLIHQTSFSVDGIAGDDLVAYHTHFINIFGNPEKAYHNSISIRGASIYILGTTNLVVSRLLPWKERILVLRKAGDWMSALNMAVTLYDGQAHGVVDLPRSLDAVHEAIMPFLMELLTSYVDEVFSYISVAFCNQIGKLEQFDDSNSRTSSVHSEIKEQYTRVGGVAVEFCVHIKRTDILFDEIFLKFMNVQQRETFLELLEPYILKDMLGSLPPEIMQALVEHYSSKGWLQRVEQCVLHMDISSLDFNQVVRLCREHGLYSALVYLFNKGLNDFRAPLEELFAVLLNSQKESATALGLGGMYLGWKNQWYRMLVYLKYCFTGLAFPPGRGTVPSTCLPSLRKELVQFLLEDSNATKSQTNSDSISKGQYLNLYHLLELDTEATLNVLRYAFIKDELSNARSSSLDSVGSDIEDTEKENDSVPEIQNLLVQNTVDAIVYILDKDVLPSDATSQGGDNGWVKEWPSMKDIGHLSEFIAYYVSLLRAKVSKSVLCQIIEYMTSESYFPNTVIIHSSTARKREKQVLALLEVLPESDWEASYVLNLCERAQFHQVCGFIHTIRHEYVAALDSYMKDVNEPIHAFSFINRTLVQRSDKNHAAIRSAIISRISELVELSREGAFHMVISHFIDENSRIISELRSHPRSLFLYLKTLIEVHLSGTLDFSKLRKDSIMNVPNGTCVKDHAQGLDAYLETISNFPKYIRESPLHVTDDLIELYLELLCQYEGGSVLKFLEMFDSYRVEHCLRMCQEYGIIDAAAYLLERVGDVGSALLLTLSGLNDKFTELGAAVEAVVSNKPLGGSSHKEVFNTVLRMKEVNDINNLLNACIGLCQRNTPRLNPEESEAHWFRLLNSFCAPLIDSYSHEKKSEREYYLGMLAGSADSQVDEDTGKSRWKIPKSHNGAHILRKLFPQFVKEIVEGMIGYVHLPTIMSKLLSDNGNQEYGDFKLTILGMLGTYGFERRILDAAKSLIEDDTFYTMSLLKKGASHGYAPRSLSCCICNGILTKNSSTSAVRVFNCGHASHLQCEALESESSSAAATSSGCPICMPNKKSQRSKNKSVIAQDGLVKKILSRRQHPHGSIIHPNESDLFENMYGSQQIPRFEILTGLQSNQRFIQIENLPQLRLAPPALYHEKVSKVAGPLTGESISGATIEEKQSRSRLSRELRVKGSSIRFPLKSSIFGKEKTSGQ